jgi:ribose-phosphate pyrophosphokinase
MATATRLLQTAGASGVIAGATDRLSASGIRDAVLTDTLPIPDSKRFPQRTVLSIAPLVANAVY